MTTAFEEQRLSGALQENILTVLCFSDEFARIVRHAVRPQLFESSVFREVAGIAIDFIDQYGEPVKDHLADHLESILQGDDQRKASSYRRLLENLELAREAVNGKYVVTELQKFVRAQNMKSALIEAVQAADDGRVDDCALAMQKGLQTQELSFDSGLNLNDPQQAMSFLVQDDKPLMTGIDVLDHYGVGPARQTLMLLLAPLNRGKSWWLMHLGKWALLQQQTVLHITLEMSEHKTAARYLQSFFSITKRQAAARVPRFIRGRDGLVESIDYEQLVRPSLADPDIAAKLSGKIKAEFSRRPPLKIKGFPTGMLTIPMLEAYLDNLERFEKIVPDVIIVDYADLMAVDPKNMRQELGEIYKRLRGLGVSRNCCIVTASQSNRDGINAKMIDERNLSEDVSKGFTADTIVTYNQTEAEHAMQLARLYVSKHRDDEARMMALISQAYGIGQFCLDSVPLMSNYWQMISGRREEEDA